MDLGKGCNTVCVTNGGLVTALAASALALGALVGCSPDAADPAPTVTSFRVEADHTAGSTCAPWTSMKKALPGVSQLPEGWTYEDQYIDVQIHSRAAQLTKLLDIFKAKLDGASPEVAAAAGRFVEARPLRRPS
jgi:hypothetical protein